MKQYTIQSFLKDNHDDEYALRVLYYHLKLAIQTNNYCLKGVGAIAFGKKFFPSAVRLYIDKSLNNPLDTLSLLLSVRTVMLKPEYHNKVGSNGLIYKPIYEKNYEWLQNVMFLSSMHSDQEIVMILGLMCSLISKSVLSNEEKQQFSLSIEKPEYRNLIEVYREEAQNSKLRITDSVVCDNAYVGDEDLVEFDLPETIRYVGNTAFSYCPNLQIIRFARPDIQFGDFPIIECENLELIVVPDGFEDYYKEQLPYFKNIIVAASKEDGYVDDELQELSQENMFDMPENVVEIDDSKIFQAFQHVATAYKFIWFRAILDLYHNNRDRELSFRDIVIKMCVIAWPVAIHQRIDLGPNDLLKRYLNNLSSALKISTTLHASFLEKEMINNYATIEDIVEPLLKNVPYRFLSPWIKYVSDADVVEKSNEPEFQAPYAIVDRKIIINRSWANYFDRNYVKLINYINENLVAYLKRYNSLSKMRTYKPI